MQVYAWPLLATLFSEVLTSDEWLRLFDNVFSNPPSFLLMCVVAYNSVNRGPLMKCEEEEDFKVTTLTVVASVSCMPQPCCRSLRSISITTATPSTCGK